jgi:hypothetical protein
MLFILNILIILNKLKYNIYTYRLIQNLLTHV